MGDNVRDGSDRDHTEERQTRRPDSRRLATDSAFVSGHVIQRIDMTPLPEDNVERRAVIGQTRASRAPSCFMISCTPRERRAKDGGRHRDVAKIRGRC
jgi:hypothetical protein